MVLKCDSAARPLRRPDGDILIEGRCALDGRVVDKLVPANRISRSVASESPFDTTLLRRITRIFHDIVLDYGIGGPAVDREETYSPGDREGAIKVDRAV